MLDLNRITQKFQVESHLVRNGYRSVPSAGAAEPDGEIRLSLFEILSQEERQHRFQVGQKPLRFLFLQNELSHLFILPRKGPEPVDKVRVGEEPEIDDEVGFEREAVPVTE